MESKLLTALALTIVSGAALAADPYREFLMLDSDKNGFLSTEEYQKINTLHKEFPKADTSGDGKLSLQEYKQSSVSLDDLSKIERSAGVQGMLSSDVHHN